MFNFNDYANKYNISSTTMEEFSKKMKEAFENNSFADSAKQGIENSANMIGAFMKNLSESLNHNSESIKKYADHAMNDFQSLLQSKNQEEIIKNNQKMLSNMINNSSEIAKDYMKHASQVAIKNFEEFNNFFQNKNNSNKNEQNSQEKNKQK